MNVQATRNGEPAYLNAPPRKVADCTMSDWINRPREERPLINRLLGRRM